MPTTSSWAAPAASGRVRKTTEAKAAPKAARTEKADKAAEPEVAAFAAVPEGAKAPLKSGNAPKGYDIKGNADSGLYHEPDGQWYDATVAEFWFKSAEDAEAAGFKRAGGAAEQEDDK